MNAERPRLGIPSSAEKSRTQVPVRGATATVLPSGLMATSGETEGSGAADPEPDRGGRRTGRGRALIAWAGQPVELADRRIEVVRIPEVHLVLAVKFVRVPVGQSIELGGQAVVGHRLDGHQPLTGRVSEHAHDGAALPRQRAERGSRQGIDEADAAVIGQQGGDVVSRQSDARASEMTRGG